MKSTLRIAALLCAPLFLCGVVVSIRSHWRPTEIAFHVQSTGWRFTADEAGFYLTQYPVLRPWSAPLIPRTFNRSARIRFAYVRHIAGPAIARMLHVPYWPFWMIITPPIVGWLRALEKLKLRATRARQNLCLLCGYDLRATPEICPECGTGRQETTNNHPLSFGTC